jgi:hypothetical protein
MTCTERFIRRTAASIIICLVILCYAISSVIALLFALGIVPHLERAALHPRTLLIYSVISFTLVAVLSAYHMYTFICRRKRFSDRLAAAA